MPRIAVTESEILDELRSSIATRVAPPGYHSVIQLATAMGCSANTVQRRIKTWTAQGRIRTTPVTETDTSGKPQRIPYYKLMTKGKRA